MNKRTLILLLALSILAMSLLACMDPPSGDGVVEDRVYLDADTDRPARKTVCAQGTIDARNK